MLWLGWAAYWIVAARHTMTNRRTESLLTGASYRVLLALGVILLASPGYHLSLANFFLCPQSAFTLAIGLCLTVCGLSIAVCARHHLGKYWSDRITLKADHRVIQSGPYAFVPHPIYSGILLALLGTVISIGTVQSCIGLAIIFVSFVRKPTLEEQWLCAHLGAAPCEGTHSVPIVTWALQNGIRLRNDRYSSSGASGLRRRRHLEPRSTVSITCCICACQAAETPLRNEGLLATGATDPALLNRVVQTRIGRGS